MLKSRVLLALLCSASVFAQIPAAQAGYKILSHIKVGGDGGWDYLTVDSKTRRLYISHGTEVVVINLDTDAVETRIPNLKGVHGIALAPELNRGFISNGQQGTVTVFALDTSKEIGNRITVGLNPDAILYEPSTKRVLTFNGRSSDVSVVDAKSGEYLGTIAMGGKPEFAVTDGKGLVWVNIEDKNEVVQFDAKTMKILNRWSVAPGDEPSALAFDVAQQRLFSGCGNQNLMIMDAKTGKIVAKAPIGDGVDAAVFDVDKKRIFTSQADGTMTIIHQETPDKYVVEDTVKTAFRARTMALDPKTHKVYLPTGEFEPEPPATAYSPHPRPRLKPDTFEIVVLGE